MQDPYTGLYGYGYCTVQLQVYIIVTKVIA